MLISMTNGVSALNAFQKALEVQSNNTANTKTMAFKSDKVSFSDMFYNNQQVGLGVSMNTPEKNFAQGSINPTGSEYDFAIVGDGFFTLQDPKNPDNLYYTRAGHFNSDNLNFLADSNGMQVMGIKPVVSGDIITAEYEKNIATSVIETDDSIFSINTYITDYVDSTTATGDTGTSGQNFKSVGSNLNDIEALIYSYNSALKAYAINPEEGVDAEKFSSKVSFPLVTPENEAYTIELQVDGVKFQQNFEESVENTLQLLSDKINYYTGVTSSVDITTGEMVIESMIPGQHLNVSQAKVNDNVVKVSKLTVESGSGQKLIDAIYSELETLVENTGGKVATNKSSIAEPKSGEILEFEPIVLDLNELAMNSTLYEKLLTGDPEAIASYPGIESDNGNIYLTEGDARFLVGKVVPITFTNKGQLNPEGDNLYTKGEENAKAFFIEGSASVVSSYLEESNVDLSNELVNILTFQKAFEANSKSITTADELLKTALALKNH